jgi:hypothetical protein
MLRLNREDEAMLAFQSLSARRDVRTALAWISRRGSTRPAAPRLGDDGRQRLITGSRIVLAKTCRASGMEHTIPGTQPR